MNFFSFVAHTSFYSAFLPTLVGIATFRKTHQALRILSVFCVITVLMDAVVTYLASFKMNNLFLFHLHSPIEFATIVIIFGMVINDRTMRVIAYSALIIFVLFCFFNIIFLESLNDFNSKPRGIEGLLVILLCLYFFYRLFTDDKSVNILTYPFFWLFAGWLIYFAGTFFLFVYSSQQGVGLNLTFSIIHSVLNIFLNLVFSYALWLGSRKLILS